MVEKSRLDTTGLTQQQIKAATCRLIAFDIHRSADHLFRTYREELFSIPSVIVLRALSVELIIKCGIIFVNGDTPRIHDLQSLFLTLPDEVRLRAKHSMKERTEKDLENVLKVEKDSFTGWRYLHESKNLKSTPEDLRNAFLALDDSLCIKYPQLDQATPYSD